MIVKVEGECRRYAEGSTETHYLELADIICLTRENIVSVGDSEKATLRYAMRLRSGDYYYITEESYNMLRQKYFKEGAYNVK